MRVCFLCGRDHLPLPGFPSSDLCLDCTLWAEENAVLEELVESARLFSVEADIRRQAVELSSAGRRSFEECYFALKAGRDG